ncbi:hypothetical protein BYT27DRAFT_7205278 [Phlegmacium glaucopus]|nr:hypothetical protein BYT27DRAFT_7205278 [Phlegmacium glaucopus]
MVDKKLEENIVQFCAVTGASTRDARKFLETHKRLDVAMDAYYNNPHIFSNSGRRKGDSAAPSSSKILTLFEKYKEPEGEDIAIDGTIKLCADLDVNPEDVVLLAVAYELKSPGIGQWKKQGWMEGWKNIGADSISEMKNALVRLRDQLGSDPIYFEKVYKHTFDFARNEGQRSIGIDTAQAFWSLLIPHGFVGGALTRTAMEDDDDGDDDDVDMDEGIATKAGSADGWKEEYLQWWFDFLNERGGKGITKDTWIMVCKFLYTPTGVHQSPSPRNFYITHGTPS